MTTFSVSVDEEILARAEQRAAAEGMSEMVERFLRVLAQPPPTPEELPPLTRQAYGMLSPMTDAEVERILDEHRMRKYGGRE